MAGNPQRYQAVLHQMENRHATAGCLLGLLFVVPFAARVYSLAPLLTAALVYVAVIVPLATGMMSTQTIVRWMRCSVATLSDVGVLSRIWMLLRLFHQSYMRLDVIHTTTNQVAFFMLAEKVMCPDQRLVCLYMLLFYTVMAYLQRSLKLHNWTRIPGSQSSRGDFLRLTTAFVAIRLGKAVVVSLVLVMLRVNFKHLEPSFPYVAVTGIHFLVTQCCTSVEPAWGDEEGSVRPAGYAITFLAIVLRWLCPQEHMEGLEERWAAFLLRCTPNLMSAAMLGLALIRIVFNLGRNTTLTGNLSVLILAAYINLMADGLRAKREAWVPLARDMNLLSNFPVKNIKVAPGESLPTCAICLDDMVGKARVTPCLHTFHGRCLRPCIQRFGECPLCKHRL
ncbi:uncharacterized protein LOC124157533 isoform X2 [Ischnura elegans]|uniref:uncharacterized protein LOC124157533 isoform X2 n=1 Tax=Ischnura elegans TaxID=197161 RepID=UPI001ED8849B|nr:uncharacterized protein LOC124157533 isoform X2 [Ischnura elegans]